MDRTIINVITGEQKVVPLTAEEIAELASRPQPVPTKEDQQINRAAAYAAEADPLFFKAQRGEVSMDDWTAKVEEIRARYPYPTEAES